MLYPPSARSRQHQIRIQDGNASVLQAASPRGISRPTFRARAEPNSDNWAQCTAVQTALGQRTPAPHRAALQMSALDTEAPAWETSKENAAPRKKGRDVAKLNRAFGAARIAPRSRVRLRRLTFTQTCCDNAGLHNKRNASSCQAFQF